MQSEIDAIRTSAALSDLPHVAYLRVRGDDALAVVDKLCPAELVLREGQLLHTLLLNDDATVFADLYVGRDDDTFWLIGEGPTPSQLAARVCAEAAGARIDIETLNDTHIALGVNGPYAWELLGEVMGPEIIGLPFASLFHFDEWLCVRAGKTGEYGYDLLVPRGEIAAARARLAEVGRRFDLGTASLEALDHCALENWFFNIRREGAAGVTPLELQLQWRISRRKEFTGAAALRARRQAGITRRLTSVVSAERLAVGDTLQLDGAVAGTLVNAGWCAPRREWIGLALVDIAVALPGVDFGGVRSYSAPAFANRSLFVNPQRHSWFTRDEEPLPPMVSP
jgi:glycine cleavage system aminomethyltransferase T